MSETHRNHIALLPSEKVRIRFIGIENLAKRTGLSVDTICRALCGQVRRKSYERIKAVLDAEGTHIFDVYCYLEALVTVPVSAETSGEAITRAKERIKDLMKTHSTEELQLCRMTSPLTARERHDK